MTTIPPVTSPVNAANYPNCRTRLIERALAARRATSDLFFKMLNPDRMLPRELAAVERKVRSDFDGTISKFEALPKGSEKLDWALSRARDVGARLHWQRGRKIPQDRVLANLLDREMLGKLCNYLRWLAYEERLLGTAGLTQAQLVDIDDLWGGYCEAITFDFWSQYEI